MVFTQEMLKQEIRKFQKRHGRYPTWKTSLLWLDVDRFLRCGEHGLPGGSSLAKLVAEVATDRSRVM